MRLAFKCQNQRRTAAGWAALLSTKPPSKHNPTNLSAKDANPDVDGQATLQANPLFNFPAGVSGPNYAYDAAGYAIPSIGSDVIDSDDVRASVVALQPAISQTSHGQVNNPTGLIVVRAAGHEIALPRDLLQRESEKLFRVSFAFASLIDPPSSNEPIPNQQVQQVRDQQVERPADQQAQQQLHMVPSASSKVVPAVQEEMQIDMRLVDTGRGVRIHKTVLQAPHVIEQPLAREEFIVEHIRQDQLINEGPIPEPRYEGDTFVIPVLEEVLVVRTQWRIKEEIRITRLRRPIMTTQTVVLKSDQVKVERFDENKGSAS